MFSTHSQRVLWSTAYNICCLLTLKLARRLASQQVFQCLPTRWTDSFFPLPQKQMRGKGNLDSVVGFKKRRAKRNTKPWLQQGKGGKDRKQCVQLVYCVIFLITTQQRSLCAIPPCTDEKISQQGKLCLQSRLELHHHSPPCQVTWEFQA